MDEGSLAALTDPAGLMLGLGSLCAIFAAGMWWRVARAAETIAAPEGWQARNWLGHAATLTAVALALAGAGYLLGRFTGRF